MTLTQAFSQDVLGNWYTKVVQEDTTHYILSLRKEVNGFSGKIDIPSKSIFRRRLDSVSLDEQYKLFFRHEGLDISFIGKIKTDQKVLDGIVKKDKNLYQTNWKRIPSAKRLQKIQEPIPYLSTDLVFTNEKENIELAGTLTLPNKQGRFPAVVLISGSGPQDRNEELLGHQPFLILADHLTRNGIAVLRYDDRGFGKSGGIFRPATMMNYAEDASAAVDFLKKHPNIDTTKIGLAGHSEGGNIAPVVAVNNKAVDFIVLLAAPGISNLDMYLVSLDLILKNYPETYDRDFAFFKSVYEDMARIQDKSVLKDSLQKKFEYIVSIMEPTELATYGDLDTYVKQEVASHSSDWYHFFLQFDVTPYLQQLKIPILALNGDKDASVEAKANLDGMQKTLIDSGHTQHKMVELKEVNHFFQVCDNDSFKAAFFAKETFSTIALEEIANWILKL